MRLCLVLMLLAVTVVGSACDSLRGEQGPEGPHGQQGEMGLNNVVALATVTPGGNLTNSYNVESVVWHMDPGMYEITLGVRYGDTMVAIVTPFHDEPWPTDYLICFPEIWANDGKLMVAFHGNTTDEPSEWNRVWTHFALAVFDPNPAND